jgi:hypothetical protein
MIGSAVRTFLIHKPTWLRFPPRVYQGINALFSDPDKVIVDKGQIEYVVIGGLKYVCNHELNSVARISDNPFHWFDDVRPTDRVLDVGACVGGFAIPIATMAKYVVAVEPLWYEELFRNRELNNLGRKLKIYIYGVGNGDLVRTQFGEKEALIQTTPFDVLIGTEGPFDIVKIDCEGAEWTTRPEFLAGTRVIHFEAHIRRGHERADWIKYYAWLKWFRHNGYNYETLTDNRRLGWGSPFVANLAVRAVKR